LILRPVAAAVPSAFAGRMLKTAGMDMEAARLDAKACTCYRTWPPAAVAAAVARGVRSGIPESCSAFRPRKPRLLHAAPVVPAAVAQLALVALIVLLLAVAVVHLVLEIATAT